MKAELLHIVTCVYNPIRWATRIAHYKKFAEHMLDSGVKLTVVECALGERPFELEGQPNVQHIGVRAETLAWNKECLINIGISRLPETAAYIGTFDADIEFRNPSWAVDTVHALQQYPVVQPWSEALDLGPKGEPMRIKGRQVQTSFAKVWRETGDVRRWYGKSKASAPPADPYAYPHPGYAWAWRRGALNNVGMLLEGSGLGAADHQMAMGIVGEIDLAVHGSTTPEYQAVVRSWGQRAAIHMNRRLGYVPGTIEHRFHGAKSKRKYHERWGVLIEHEFNPLTDLKRNAHGVVELAGNKPMMEHAFDAYHRARDEDANVLFDE